MKSKLLSIFFLLAGMGAFAKMGNMGIGTATPNSGAKFDVAINHGATNKLFTTNTKGIAVNTAVAFNNCGTSTFHINRAAGLAAAIQFLGTAVLLQELTPITETAVNFTNDGTASTKHGGIFTTLTANSSNTAAVSVPANMTRVALEAAGVTLSLKVFLEGPMLDGTSMNAILQDYNGGNSGWLPQTSPYGAPTNTYSQISYSGGPNGIIVDWIKVEIRLASNNYSTAAETQSLLLKPDGTIISPTGAVPEFATQTGTVRIVIIHRNHLAVMSNDIINFNSATSYDFTTLLSQSVNDFGDPPQMKTAFGVWVMIAGDVNMDNSIETLDQNLIRSSLARGDTDEYFSTDIDLSGVINDYDEDILFPNFLTGYYSTLTNY